MFIYKKGIELKYGKICKNISRISEFKDHTEITLNMILEAKKNIKGLMKTPIIKLKDSQIFAKLENLHEEKSYKIRGATNVLKILIKENGLENLQKNGLITASVGIIKIIY
jgi:threonine dehydratase